MTTADAFAPWRLDPGFEPTLVRRSSNEVWRAARGGQTVYVRLTPDSHRAAAEVEAEIAWMTALHADGIRVVEPLASAGGALVERALCDGQPASSTCLAAAPGRPARKPDDYAPAIIDSWADLLADLHAHARDRPRPASGGRRLWSEDRVFLTAREASDPRTRPAEEALRALVAWMERLPRDRDAFGLTHADLHLGNLAVDGSTVTAFDFDDACLHWFAHDVAVAITSIRKAAWEYPGQVNAEAVEDRFVERTFARGVLGPLWRARLEAFVAYRIALSACWASRSAELGVLDAEMQAWYERSLPWWTEELSRRRAHVERAMAVGG